MPTESPTAALLKQVSATPGDVSPGDVVQIIDEKHPWFGCLLIVTEVRSWGVLAGAPIPTSNAEQAVTTAFNRLQWELIARIGAALVLPA